MVASHVLIAGAGPGGRVDRCVRAERDLRATVETAPSAARGAA